MGKPWETILEEEAEPILQRALGARPRSVYSFLGWKAIDGFSMVVEVVVEGYFGQGDFSGCG